MPRSHSDLCSRGQALSRTCNLAGRACISTWNNDCQGSLLVLGIPYKHVFRVFTMPRSHSDLSSRGQALSGYLHSGAFWDKLWLLMHINSVIDTIWTCLQGAHYALLAFWLVFSRAGTFTDLQFGGSRMRFNMKYPLLKVITSLRNTTKTCLQGAHHAPVAFWLVFLRAGTLWVLAPGRILG